MKRARQGSMLIELCTTISAGSMVLFLGVVLIEQTMRWSRSMQKHSDTQRELSRLADSWREDFSRARRVEFQSTQRVTLDLPGKEIVYESSSEKVERRCSRTKGDAITPLGTEFYVLGNGYVAQFDSSLLVVRAVNPAGEPTGVRLRVLGKSTDKRYQIVDFVETTQIDEASR
ncbi:MAG: hypothetical protein ACK6DC_01995 [Planctomycetota bacterium]|jgi:hypothetical protein